MLRFSDNLIAQMTLGCNCQCQYCYEGKTHDSQRYIDHETFKKVLDKYLYDRCILGSIENYLNFHFHGGEVLTIPWDELQADILYLKQRRKFFPNLCMSIQTNGTLLDEEKAKFFAENQIEVGISWDGYKSLRMPEAANRALINKLRDLHSKYPVKFQFLLTLSQDNLTTWIPDARSVSDISTGFGINTICTLEDNDFLAVSPEDQWEYWLKPVLESFLTDDPLRERAVVIAIEKLIATDVLITANLSKRKAGCFDRVCGFGVNMTAITPDLVMHNCDKFMEEGPYISKRAEYRLTDSDLWGLQQIKRLSQHYTTMLELEHALGCNQCPASWICNGECQSYNISRFGVPKIDPNLCRSYLNCYEFFTQHWPEILSHDHFRIIGDVEGITPQAKAKLLASGYELRIETPAGAEPYVYTVKTDRRK